MSGGHISFCLVSVRGRFSKRQKRNAAHTPNTVQVKQARAAESWEFRAQMESDKSVLGNICVILSLLFHSDISALE